MSISDFIDDNIVLYFQYPERYTLEKLRFLNSYSKGNTPEYCCGLGGLNRVEQCPNYWMSSKVGCLKVHRGRFPLKEVYDPPSGINLMGMDLTGTQMRGELQAKLTKQVKIIW